MVPVVYLMSEVRPQLADPWALHAAFWAVVAIASGLALFAASLLVIGWSRFTVRDRLNLALLALFL